MGLLAIRSVTKSFGGVKAVDACSMEIVEGRVIGLIGPNGSGKTTLLNVINGLYKPEAGEILFKGEPITGLPPHEVFRRGISRTFQILRVFRQLTALENVLIPFLDEPQGLADLRGKAIEALRFVGLAHHENTLAGELSGGEQRLLEFARALVPGPTLVLMDEPLTGVHPAVKEKLLQGIETLNEEGITFLIVSHDVPSLMKVSHHVFVMNAGSIIAEGTPDEIRRDERVIEAYLGSSHVS